MDRVEFLVAWDDGTWTTTIEEVPPTVDSGNAVQWADETLAPQAQYRKAVLFALYNLNPEGAEDGLHE